jgi:hypothetical protein
MLIVECEEYGAGDESKSANLDLSAGFTGLYTRGLMHSQYPTRCDQPDLRLAVCHAEPALRERS